MKLTELQKRILETLKLRLSNKNKNKLSVLELSQILDKERSGIQKAIQGLLDENLILQIQENQERGYKYLYKYNREDYEEKYASIVLERNNVKSGRGTDV